VTTVAGIVLLAFGAGGAWFLSKRFPNARFLIAGYALMGGGGACFVLWSVAGHVAIGVAAAALVAVGGAIGAIGAVRKELRF